MASFENPNDDQELTEMDREAAWQLLQLSEGETTTTTTTKTPTATATASSSSSGGSCYTSFRNDVVDIAVVGAITLDKGDEENNKKKRIRRENNDDDDDEKKKEIKRSSMLLLSSPEKEDEDEDEDDEEAMNLKRKNRRYRSIVELYKVTKPILC